VKYLNFIFFAELHNSCTNPKSATAGNSAGRYSFVVHSSRILAVGIITDHTGMSSLRAHQHVQTLIKVFAHIFINSSTAIAVEGHPIQVEVTETGIQLYIPV